jgi:transcriptional regulator with XRE-family HTH domain
MSIKNVTNAEFAQAISVQPSNISHILSGRNKPSLDLIMKIIKRYPEVRLEWLLQGSGSMNKDFGMDLFSDQKVTQGRIGNPDDSNKPKIQEAGHDNSSTSPPFEAKKVIKVSESPREQRDTRTFEDTNPGTGKIESPGVNFESDSEVEKIVIFYRDKSFEEYFPRSI